ncbi:MAG: glycosyltransferase [Deltaproteobacteria bacterium]|nr:glycosyltransferase [Deltaproteobacteria bacterium]
MTAAPALAIVIPAHNEAERIGATLDAVRAYLEATAIDAELIVVDDGSIDATVTIAAARAPAASIVHMRTNRGKGAALRAGVRATTARHILTCDADLATPLDELPRFIAALEAGADIVAGSRHIAGARIDHAQPWARRALGGVFRAVTSRVLRLPVRDAMCGFKAYRGDVARWLFAQTVIDDYASDIELMYLARDRFRVVELPVQWRHVDGSRVRIPRAAWRAACDVARVMARGSTNVTQPPSRAAEEQA